MPRAWPRLQKGGRSLRAFENLLGNIDPPKWKFERLAPDLGKQIERGVSTSHLALAVKRPPLLRDLHVTELTLPDTNHVHWLFVSLCKAFTCPFRSEISGGSGCAQLTELAPPLLFDLGIWNQLRCGFRWRALDFQTANLLPQHRLRRQESTTGNLVGEKSTVLTLISLTPKCSRKNPIKPRERHKHKQKNCLKL